MFLSCHVRTLKQIKTKQKNKKEDFLVASLLGNMLAGRGVIRAGEGTARVGYGSKRSSFKKFLIPPHPLTNFEIQKYLDVPKVPKCT